MLLLFNKKFVVQSFKNQIIRKIKYQFKLENQNLNSRIKCVLLLNPPIF